jgi:Carboxylesterase family
MVAGIWSTTVFVWCIIFISHQSIAHGYSSVIVHTKYGDVEGYETDLTRVFYGIPYAQPPVDTLRYEAISFV